MVRKRDLLLSKLYKVTTNKIFVGIFLSGLVYRQLQGRKVSLHSMGTFVQRVVHIHNITLLYVQYYNSLLQSFLIRIILKRIHFCILQTQHKEMYKDVLEFVVFIRVHNKYIIVCFFNLSYFLDSL